MQGRWFVDADGKISTKGNVFLPRHTRTIPVPFGKVVGYFVVEESSQLESFYNCPEKVVFHFMCEDSELITSLDHIPSWIGGNCNIRETSIPDLHNIHKKIQHLGGSLSAGHSNGILKSHVLGVLLLKPHLPKGFWLAGVPDKVNQILNGYIKRESRDIYAAQEDLISAGLEEFAQL